jgi:hypothetical protein
LRRRGLTDGRLRLAAGAEKRLADEDSWLGGELESVHAAERDARTAANLARAQQLAEEARQLIVGYYARAANAIAETLARLATISREVRALNALLPPVIAEIQIEAFRGYRATLGGTVKLPGIMPEEADFWPPRPCF